MDLDQELALVINSGNHPTFTADDITLIGRLTVDPAHTPNGPQSAIGRAFRAWSSRGLIEWTGAAQKSRAPHRRSGLNRVWRATDKGKAWAASWTQLNPPPSS